MSLGCPQSLRSALMAVSADALALPAAAPLSRRCAAFDLRKCSYRSLCSCDGLQHTTSTTYTYPNPIIGHAFLRLPSPIHPALWLTEVSPSTDNTRTFVMQVRSTMTESRPTVLKYRYENAEVFLLLGHNTEAETGLHGVMGGFGYLWGQMCTEERIGAAQDELIHNRAELIALLCASLHFCLCGIRFPACHNRYLHSTAYLARGSLNGIV